MPKRLIAALALFIALSGCSEINGRVAEAAVEKPLPAMSWQHRPGSEEWTRAAYAALDAHGKTLVATEPKDISRYCPGYSTAGPAERQAFWTGLISALAKHESTWRQDAVGGGGKWFGLVQIAPATARGYGCSAKSGEALKNGAANVSCAIRIMAHTVPRDGVVSAGGRGVAADWGPFHSSRKREEIARWTRSQEFCKASA